MRIPRLADHRERGVEINRRGAMPKRNLPMNYALQRL
jgi:hypothetical protein